MKRKNIGLGLLLGVLLLGSGQAQAAHIDMVLNISGVSNQLSTGEKPYIWNNPLAVELPVGTYQLTPVNASYPGAMYTAYSYFGYGGTWSALYFMAPDPQNITRYGTWDVFDTAELAFAAAVGGVFTLDKATKIYFGVNDSYYYDNRGGVSVHLTEVSAVPLPAALPLMGAGLAGLAGLARLRRKKG